MFQKIWTPQMILNHIQESTGKEPLNSHYYAVNHPRIYAAAERIFGSWGNAIAAAGLDYQKIRKYQTWSKMRIVQEIRKASQRKEELSSQFVQQNRKALYMAAIHHFESWGNAIRAAGLDYQSIRQRRLLTPSELKKQIFHLYKNGEDLAYPNMRKNYQYLLASGMKKLGNGSWAEARMVCGIQKNFRCRKSIDLLQKEETA